MGALSPAHASFALTYGQYTPVGAGSATIDYSGTYATPLPSPLAQPFVASPFSLSFTMPSQGTISTGNDGFFFPIGASGTYTDNGRTESFTGASVRFTDYSTFDATTQQLVSTYGFDLTIFSLLTPNDQLAINIATSQMVALTAAGNGELVTFLPGAFQGNGGTATYFVGLAAAGPPGAPTSTSTAVATGGTGSTASTVPEPGSLWLLLTAAFGLLAAGAATRRLPTRAAAAATIG